MRLATESITCVQFIQEVFHSLSVEPFSLINSFHEIRPTIKARIRPSPRGIWCCKNSNKPSLTLCVFEKNQCSYLCRILMFAFALPVKALPWLEPSTELNDVRGLEWVVFISRLTGYDVSSCLHDATTKLQAGQRVKTKLWVIMMIFLNWENGCVTFSCCSWVSGSFHSLARHPCWTFCVSGDRRWRLAQRNILYCTVALRNGGCLPQAASNWITKKCYDHENGQVKKEKKKKERKQDRSPLIGSWRKILRRETCSW